MALFRPLLFSARNCIVRLPPREVRTIKRWMAPTLKELERRRKKMEPQPPDPRSTYLEWNFDAEVYAFAKRVGEDFDDKLLRKAFSHRSYVIQQEMKHDATGLDDNRELIEDGDRFISSYIRQKFEKVYLKDGVEAIHGYLTSEAMLAHVSFHMGTKDIILCAEFPPDSGTLAKTFKALVAALKQSKGEEQAATFVNDFLVCQLHDKDLFDVWQLKNPYEYLLNLLKVEGVSEVEPRLCNQSATNTILANYQVGLYSNKKLMGIGWGETVQTAKDTAALDAIERIQRARFKKSVIL